MIRLGLRLLPRAAFGESHRENTSFLEEKKRDDCRMKYYRPLDRLAASIAALAGLLPCLGMWRTEATRPLFAGVGAAYITPALLVYDQRTLRIGAQRCRWADAPQHDWPICRRVFG